MTYKNVLTVSAILGFLYGLGFMFIPGQLVSFYSVTLNDSGLFVSQLFGAALLGFGVLAWLGRDLNDAQGRQTVLTASFVMDALGFIFSLIAQLRGVGGINALGWTTVLIYLLLALAIGYLRFFSR